MDMNGMNQQPAYVQPAAPQGSKGLGIASMVLGIVSLVLCCFVPWVPLILGLVGLILGGVAIAKKMPGKGMAIAGLVCSIITVVLYVITMIAGASALSWLQSLV